MSFVLMAYGPFTFSLTTFSYEELKRRAEARIESVKIIGTRPSLHKSGLEVEKVDLKCGFCPRHIDGNRGLYQVSSLRASLGLSYPILGNRIGIGDVLGSWVLNSVEETHTEIFVDGIGQVVQVDLELLYDGRQRTPAAASAFARLVG
jgi:phage protein U